MSKSETLEEKHIGNLYDNVHVTAEIICSKCDVKGEVDNCDNYDAANYFYEDGWYSTGKTVYCPHCNAVRLKNLEKRRRK